METKAKGQVITFTYDDLHRLTDETNNGGYGAMHVTYNAIGNITEKTVGPSTFYLYYDSSHKHAVDYVTSGGTNYDYTYDANGNMTQGYDFSNLANIQVRTVTYNVDNMPVSIYHGSGTTAALLYDGTGARAKKTVSGGSSSTTYYIGEHFEVKDGTAVKYIFAGNLRVARMEGSTRSYFHKDHLGSSTLMTDATGALVESTNYEPFGGRRDHTGTDTSAYKFTDQEFDAENGLYNYDARMYDPVIGRFISPDSIVPDLYNPQSLNRYSYCLNNPLIYTDPTGHAGWEGTPYESPYVLGGLNSKANKYIASFPGTFYAASWPTFYKKALKAATEALKIGLGVAEAGELPRVGEGSEANIAKRETIDELARSYDGNTAWRIGVQKDDFTAEQNKCNKFVFDVLKEAGTPAYVDGRQPTAWDWATPKQTIENWRILGIDETPQPGDVAAIKFSDPIVNATGHCGIMISDGNGGVTNISAHASSVYTDPTQFTGTNVVFRRYTGE